jgi:hypothetical protein
MSVAQAVKEDDGEAAAENAGGGYVGQ